MENNEKEDVQIKRENGFYVRLAKKYIESMEEWDHSPSEKISVACFASFLDRMLSVT